MSAPVFIWLVLVVIGVIGSVFTHGETTEKNAVAAFIGVPIQLSLLIWGGFFKFLGVPQAIYIGLIVVGLLMALKNHGEIKKQNFFGDIIGIGLTALLFWWGGFFG